MALPCFPAQQAPQVCSIVGVLVGHPRLELTSSATCGPSVALWTQRWCHFYSWERFLVFSVKQLLKNVGLNRQTHAIAQVTLCL